MNHELTFQYHWTTWTWGTNHGAWPCQHGRKAWRTDARSILYRLITILGTRDTWRWWILLDFDRNFSALQSYLGSILGDLLYLLKWRTANEKTPGFLEIRGDTFLCKESLKAWVRRHRRQATLLLCMKIHSDYGTAYHNKIIAIAYRVFISPVTD